MSKVSIEMYGIKVPTLQDEKPKRVRRKRKAKASPPRDKMVRSAPITK